MKNKNLILLFLGVLFSGLLIPTEYLQPQYEFILQSPSFNFLLGTDDLGRSNFFNLYHAMSLSLFISSVALGCALVFSLIVSIFSLFNKKNEFIFMRIIDFLDMIPGIVWVSLIMGVFGVGLNQLERTAIYILSLAFVFFPSLYKGLRAIGLEVLSLPHIEGAKAIGNSKYYIFKNHMWSYLWSGFEPVFFSKWVSIILTESFISFLGFGIRPPQASMGTLLYRSWQNYYSSPYLFWVTGIVFWLLIVCIRKLSPFLDRRGLKAQETDQ